eukprot:g5081.t1
MALYFNGRQSALISLLVQVLCFVLTASGWDLELHMDSTVRGISPWCILFGSVAFWLAILSWHEAMLALKRRKPTAFFDTVCIDQSNEEKKREGIEAVTVFMPSQCRLKLLGPKLWQEGGANVIVQPVALASLVPTCFVFQWVRALGDYARYNLTQWGRTGDDDFKRLVSSEASLQEAQEALEGHARQMVWPVMAGALSHAGIPFWDAWVIGVPVAAVALDDISVDIASGFGVNFVGLLARLVAVLNFPIVLALISISASTQSSCCWWMNSACRDSAKLGEQCHQHCAVGYENTTEETNFVCQSNGLATGSQTSCQPIACEGMSVNLSRVQHTCQSGSVFPRSCYASCIQGYSAPVEQWFCGDESMGPALGFEVYKGVTLRGSMPNCTASPCEFNLPVGSLYSHNCSGVVTGRLRNGTEAVIVCKYDFQWEVLQTCPSLDAPAALPILLYVGITVGSCAACMVTIAVLTYIARASKKPDGPKTVEARDVEQSAEPAKKTPPPPPPPPKRAAGAGKELFHERLMFFRMKAAR